MSRPVLLIAIGNLLSKGVGLGREILFASWFGTGAVAAAFRVAQTAYLLPTQALVGDSLSAGLIPLYRKIREEDPDKARTLVLVAALYGLAFSLTVTAFLYFAAEPIVQFIAPGAHEEAQELAASLLKVLSLATPFYIFSSILGYVETAHGRYQAVALRPLLLNLGSIAGAALAVYLSYDLWLATGILASHVIILAWTLVGLRSLPGVLPKTIPSASAVRQVSFRFFRNMIAVLGLPLAAQINVLVERIVSSWLGTEVIPSVDYARIVSDTIVNLIAMPLGILTISTRGGHSGEKIHGHVAEVAAMIIVLSFPIAAYVSINAVEIVQALFGRGEFDSSSVAVTAGLLRWMSGALGATVTAYYLVKALNAQMRNFESLILTVIACLGNSLVNLLLWQEAGTQTPGIGVAAYSLILFGLCIWRCQLGAPLMSLFLWVAAGCAVQVAVMLSIRDYATGTFALAVSGMATAAIWLIMAFLVAPIRNAIRPLLSMILPHTYLNKIYAQMGQPRGDS